MHISAHLDKLRYTVPVQKTVPLPDQLLAAVFSHPALTETGEKANSSRGYDMGLKLANGAVYWHSQRPEQGIGVQIPGSGLQVLRRQGVEEIGILRHVRAVSAHVTTMDGCLNIHDSGGNVIDFLEAHKAGLLRTSSRQIGHYASYKAAGGKWHSGETVYIGSPASDRQIRIYNKAAQLGIPGDWIRIEIAWHGVYAQEIAVAMVQCGIETAIRTELRQRLYAPFAWYAEALEGELGNIVHAPKPPSKTFAWLVDVVMPVLERELRHEADRREGLLYAKVENALYSVEPTRK